MKPPLRLGPILILATAAILGGRPAPGQVADPPGSFDVVIAGGSTAAFAAAVAAAESGARTALIEPTDWVGGQLTASAVPAVDEAWHKVGDRGTGIVFDVAAVARHPANMTPNFRAMLAATGNPGGGWVSRFCFLPRDFLDRQLLPLAARVGGNLVIYRDAVVKAVAVDPASGQVRSLTAIQRTPRPGLAAGGYDRPLSADLADWYSPEPSPRFAKTILRFEATLAPGRSTVFLDATDWGEVLALSGAAYAQGSDGDGGGGDARDEACGQAITVGIVERIDPTPTAEPAGPGDVPALGYGMYRDRPDAWERIWTYRRLRGSGPKPAVGDLSLQNWGYSARDGEGGNDYPFGSLFPSKRATAAQRADWRGGVDLAVLAAAERRALGWHAWFKAHAPPPFVPGQVVLDREALGTSTGLAKMPYIRDARRSIGLDGFVLRAADLGKLGGDQTGKRFRDRVALGAYVIDVHELVGCEPPAAMIDERATLPFFIPFRALTHERLGNFLVAGKTMAQTYWANAATRLHPIEWATGTAAGVAAAAMSRHGWTSRQALDRVAELQALIRPRTPIDWTIGDRTVPAPGEETPR